MDSLKKIIKELSDEEILDRYYNQKDTFTESALSCYYEEIKNRGLFQNDDKQSSSSEEIVELDENNFIPLDHSFNKIELEFAVTILRDNKILFFVDNTHSSDIIPIESEAEKQFSLHIYQEHSQRTHELLDEHFEKVEGRYLFKQRSIVDQLKSLSFHQISITEQESEESVEVEFSKEEISFIINQGKDILSNADVIEQEQEYVIFYYDSFESLLKRLQNNFKGSYTKNELLTILEILKISALRNRFPSNMEDASKSLIDLFIH